MRAAAAAILPLLLLVAPAAGATAVRGSVEFGSDALLAGEVVLASPDGALDLAQALRLAEPFALSWSGARGSLVSVEWTVVRDPTGEPSSVDSQPREQQLPLGPGTLRGVSCAGDCELLVLAVPGEGSASLRGNLSGPPRWSGEPLRYWAHWSNGHPGSFLREFPAGTLLASGRPHDGLPATLLAQARPAVSGRVGVFFTNATVEIETAEGRRLVDTLSRSTPVGGVEGLARVEKVRSSFVYLEADDASLLAPPGSAALLLAPSQGVSLAGTLQAVRATGRLAMGGASSSFEDAPLLLEGALELRLEVKETPVADVAGAPSLGGRRLHAEVAGDVTRAQVGPAFLVEAPASTADVAARGLAALAGAWLLQRMLLAPLYSRITRSRVLANENRGRLHRIVRDRPGRTAADLARETGIARVVVLHHLRMLESHRLVFTRLDGRKRRFFAAEAQGATDAAALSLLLEDTNRRKVAEALRASPTPLTQKDLARQTGLSQRVVSYHLARLAEARLLVIEGGMPRRYTLDRAAWRRVPSSGTGASDGAPT